MRQLSRLDTKRIKLAVKRYDASAETFTESTYDIEVDRFTTILDTLIAIKERLDPTLSMRYSCNMGICGSCGMVINGMPRLACETNIYALRTNRITVGPMEAHPVLRDLVGDFDVFFTKHKSVEPWLVRRDEEEKFRAEKEYVQTRSQVDYYLDFANCIKCGLCVDSCPVSNTNPGYLGPQALSQAYRYNSDSRDEGEHERLSIVDTMEGAWGCEGAGACSKVCPKGVDPMLTIQLLKMNILRRGLAGKTVPDKKAK